MCKLVTRIALLLTLVFAGANTAHAQLEGDLSLLAEQAGVPPNVMIVFDTSGSMRRIVWDGDTWDSNVFYDRGPGSFTCRRCTNGSCTSTGSFSTSTLSGTAGQCLGSNHSTDSCPNNENDTHNQNTRIRCDTSDVPVPCAQAWPIGTCTTANISGTDRIIFTLPRPTGWTGTASWADNYVYYLLQRIVADGQFPAEVDIETRTQGGQRALRTLLDTVNPDDPMLPLGYLERVRFGLARYNFSSGGRVVERIEDGNKARMHAAVNTMFASGGTPLSEAYESAAQYFVGNWNSLGSTTGSAVPYPAYNLTDNAGTVPPSPIDPNIPCRGNFIIVITDGLATQDDHDQNLAAFNATIGDADGDGDVGNGDWTDDVAEFLFQNDLIDDGTMPGLQNIITYTVGFSIDIPVLQDAAVNGDGEYFTSNSADELAAQLSIALQSIVDRGQSFTAATVPSSRTLFDDGFFRSFFEPQSTQPMWPGHVEAYRLDQNFVIKDSNGDDALDVNGEFLDTRVPYWDAGAELADVGHPTRNLYSTKLAGRVNLVTLNETDLGIVPADIPLYNLDPALPANEATVAASVLGYLAGEDAFDDDADGIHLAERRNIILGDIFHSNPVVVGTPPPFHFAEDGFFDFLVDYARRDRQLYVGANDGMLHSFNAGVLVTDPNGQESYDLDFASTGGQEAFGYVPGFLQSTIKEIPLNTVTSRTFGVDGSPSVADAWLDVNDDYTKVKQEWNTVLVTGARRGGQGYLALDITDPTAFAPEHAPYPRFLWEFASDPNQPIGQSWSKPIITRIKREGGPGGDRCGGDDGDGDCYEQWVAIFGGGYSPDGDPMRSEWIADPNDPLWTPTGKGIFVVDLETGALLASAAYGNALDADTFDMLYAMPSDPAVLDLNFDGFADVVYIGDLGGQMWKWDLENVATLGTSGLVDNWDVGRFFVSPITPLGSGGNHYRAIYAPPAASLIDGELLLAWGTGERNNLQYDHDATPEDDANRFYVVRDDGVLGTSSSIPVVPHDEGDVTQLNGFFQDPNPNDQGFYLVGEGSEKFVTNHLAFAGFILTSSFVFDTSNDPCAIGAGSAFLYVFDLLTGEGLFDDGSTPADGTRKLDLGSGLPTDPQITVSTGGDHTLEGSVLIQTSDGRVGSTAPPPNDTPPVKLVFWRQQL